MQCPAPRKQHAGFVSDVRPMVPLTKCMSQKCACSLDTRRSRCQVTYQKIINCKARELLLLYKNPRLHSRSSCSLVLLWVEPDLRVCEVNSHLPLTVKQIWKCKSPKFSINTSFLLKLGNWQIAQCNSLCALSLSREVNCKKNPKNQTFCLVKLKQTGVQIWFQC